VEKQTVGLVVEATVSGERLDSAIAAAQERLLAELRETEVAAPGSDGEDPYPPGPKSVLDAGYWCAELEADSTLESDYILFLYLLNPCAYGEKIRKLANTVASEQLTCGAWNIYHGGPGDLSASVKAYFALKLAGHSPHEPMMAKAREAILRMGGAERVNSYTKIYLSLLEQFDWSEVPALPPEIVLLPRFFYFNIYEISYWSRAILIPLSILYAKRPRFGESLGISIREIFWSSVDGNGNGRTLNGNGNANGRNGSTFHRAGENGHEPHLSPSRVRGAPLNGTAHVNGNGKSSSDASRWQLGRNNPTAWSPNGNGHASNGSASSGNPSITSGRGAENGSTPPRSVSFFSWRNFFIVMDRLLKLHEKTPLKPLRGLALKKAEQWIVARLEDSDGLGAIFPSMVNSVLAMRCLGYDEHHPLVANTIEKLRELEIEEDDAIRLQPCLSPVWDTALAMNALQESGLRRDHAALMKSARWLVSKEVRRPGDWQVRAPGVEVSGWAFQFQNDFYPDIDDTAAVLMALERVDIAEVPGLVDSISRGLNWMVSMQNSNGGWAAFDVDVERAALTHVPYADHNAMLDPACADITGRVLEALGRVPTLWAQPKVQEAIRRGVEYLKRSQKPDGSWYGRWGVNYIYGTWQAMKGLLAVGEDPRADYIRRAVAFIKRHQNDDGGWGESCASYNDARQKARGPSTASQTAWGLMGLMAAGEVESPEVERGIEYLLSTQGEDGNWEEDHWTGTGFPSVFYLKYHLYRLYFPLFALGSFRNLRDGVSTVRERPDIRLGSPSRRADEAPAKRGALRSFFSLSRP
jgi:squalene cyclase